VSEIGDTTNAEMRMPYLLKIMIEIPWIYSWVPGKRPPILARKFASH
jgi:hypothetical protein